MKIRIAFFCIAAVVAGCSSVSTRENLPGAQSRVDPREVELRAVIAQAAPVIENLLGTLNRGDYEGYRRDFDDVSQPARERFSAFHKDMLKKIGPYEKGMQQVNKIEQYPGYFKIYYFVKFQAVPLNDPVLVILKLRHIDGGLRIVDAAYRHRLLGL